MPRWRKTQSPWPSRPFDGFRGGGALPGWWITLEEAQNLVDGEKWWTKEAGITEEVFVDGVRQHLELMWDNEKPVWLYKGGRMYLGGWKLPIYDEPEDRPFHLPEGHSFEVEDGYGALCYCGPKMKENGCVIVGKWANGRTSGKVEMFWLKNSDVWTKNDFPPSMIRVRLPHQRGRGRGLPYRSFAEMDEELDIFDKQAKITLKDGTIRIGPWKKDPELVDEKTSLTLKDGTVRIGPSKKNSKGKWFTHELVGGPTLHQGTAQGLVRSIVDSKQQERARKKPRHQYWNTANSVTWPAVKQDHIDIIFLSSDEEDSVANFNGNSNAADGRVQAFPGAASSNAANGRAHASPAAATSIAANGRAPASPGAANSIAACRRVHRSPAAVTSTAVYECARATSAVGHTPTADMEAEKRKRIGEMRDWIINDVINYGEPDGNTMFNYARRLYDLGFESVADIKDAFDESDLEEVRMKYKHKRAFLARIRDGWSRSAGAKRDE